MLNKMNPEITPRKDQILIETKNMANDPALQESLEREDVSDHCKMYLKCELSKLFSILEKDNFQLHEKTKKIDFDENHRILPDDQLEDYYIYFDKDRLIGVFIADNLKYDGNNNQVKKIIEQNNFNVDIVFHPPKDRCKEADCSMNYRKGLKKIFELIDRENIPCIFAEINFRKDNKYYTNQSVETE